MVGVAVGEGGLQALPTAVVEPVRGAGQQPPRPVQRVLAAAAVPDGGLLHTAADVIDHAVAQPHRVEAVHHQLRVGQLLADRAGVASNGSTAATATCSRQAGS